MRSSDLETSESSSGNATGAETNTAALVPSSSNLPFHNHRGLSTLLRKSVLRDRFQFLEETRICLPHLGEKSCALAHDEVCFYEANILRSLRFHVHPFIMELLHYLNIAYRQLMPNSWRIVISCKEI